MNFRGVAAFIFLSAALTTACGRNPYFTDARFRPWIPALSVLPCDTAVVTMIGAYGTIVRHDGSTYFHNGIDITTADGGRFYSCADGVVTKVDLDTGDGLPGTNYRIFVRISSRATLDYHFEIGGSVPEQRRQDNIFVKVGQQVTTGQHLANLIYAGEGCHVHFWVMEDGSDPKCPLEYFTSAAGQRFERLFDYPWVVKYPIGRADLCQ